MNEESSSIFDIRELQDNPESLYVNVKKDYILTLNQTIKELHRILKIRLRVECDREFNDLKQILQQKLQVVVGLHEKIETQLFNISRQEEENKENKILALKYKELLSVFNQANENFRLKNEEQISKISKLRKENEELAFKIQSFQVENENLVQLKKELSKKLDEEKRLFESHEIYRKKLEAERDALKHQNMQANNLLKKQQESFSAKSSQRLEEKDKILEKIAFLSQEFDKAKESLNQKIVEKDMIIAKLERKCKMLENEKELLEDMKNLERNEMSSGKEKEKTTLKTDKPEKSPKVKKKKKKLLQSASSPENIKTPEKK